MTFNRTVASCRYKKISNLTGDTMFAMPMHKIIFFMFYAYVLVDAFNGLLIRQGFFSVSIIYKLCLLALIISFLRIYKQALLIFCTLMAYLSIHFIYSKNFINPLSDLDILIRFYSVIIYYMFFREMIKRGHGKNIFIVSYLALTIIFINLLLGRFGFGFAQYGSSGDGPTLGTRGFFYSGNELASATVVAISFLLMRLIEYGKYGKFLFYALINIVMAFLSMTKTAIISSIILTLFFPLIKTCKKITRLRIKKKSSLFTLFLFIVLPTCFFIAVKYAMNETGIFDRWAYFYEKSNDLISFMLSGRNSRVEDALSAFTHNFGPMEMLFGVGNEWSTEIDFFDILMKAGISGAFLSYGFYFFMLRKSILCIKSNPYSIYSAFIIFLLICISFTAGHTLFSGMAGPLIGALLALGTCRTYLEPRKISSLRNNMPPKVGKGTVS